jgi:hypothetical protein
MVERDQLLTVKEVAAILRLSEWWVRELLKAGRLKGTPARQVVFFKGRAKGKPPTYSALMKHKIDTEQGRHYYSRRLGIVEPVFANIRSTLGLDRFSVRGTRKVNNQWLLYAMVHNIGKLQRYGKLQPVTEQQRR